mgnify:CR=1 FL=1
MKIVLATSNLDKVKEIKEFLKGYEIYALSEIVKPFEIVEDGSTFQQNALIKSKAVFAKLKSLCLKASLSRLAMIAASAWMHLVASQGSTQRATLTLMKMAKCAAKTQMTRTTEQSSSAD